MTTLLLTSILMHLSFFMVQAIAQPSFSAREIISFDGIWQLEASDKRPETWHHSILVPGLVDIAKPSVNWEAQKCFWYKKTFTLTSSQTRGHAFLKIGQSKYGTEVWLNEKYIGSYIGCYTSHKYNATKAINYNGENTLIVKVGLKKALPKIGAVGGDYEKKSYIPGIWGDVSLILAQNPIIERVQIIPHIDSNTAEARITLKNLEKTNQNIVLSSKIIEKISGLPASDSVNTNCSLTALEEKTFTINLPISNMKLWSPEYPFLYKLVSRVKSGNKETDTETTIFGVREFKIAGSDFYLNGKRIFLKGGNIAFHRFLSDPDRKSLPWDEKWIKKMLIDIPKEHNFNFFRNHLGQMYNKWYDIADEYGMLIHNEWLFWVITGTETQIRKEFTQWLYDNWNHPSIIIWGAVNETNDDKSKMLKNVIMPEMKKLDPTRPWEYLDFLQEHPYIYSFGPALNTGRFGFSRSVDDLKNSSTPTLLNEFIWFWLDKNGKPTSLTEQVLPRWLGKHSTPQQRFVHQAQLASDLCELWRRLDIDGIAPFVYLSSEGGCTSNWFTGDIADPEVKPIMTALKNAFAPFGISIELWDRHFFPEEKRSINVYIFNDTYQNKSGVLNCKITNEAGSRVFFEKSMNVTVPANGKRIENVIWTMPPGTGSYYIKAELIEDSKVAAVSKKMAHIYKLVVPDNLSSAKIMVYDPDDEILNYLTSAGLKNVSNYNSSRLSGQDILILGEGTLLDDNYNSRMEEISDFVKEGHSLIVVEPSYGITNYKRAEYSLFSDLSMAMNKRKDEWTDGYDSYCFAENLKFPLWNNIDGEHLKMFNGGWGGEIISQCDVEFQRKKLILAKSGNNLKYPNVIETNWGDGVIVVSRVQVRGRLTEVSDPGTDLYSRREDPVAQQYLLNLLSNYLDASSNWKRLNKTLGIFPDEVVVSSIENQDLGAYKAIDGDFNTRWASKQSDPQWIYVEFAEPETFSTVKLNWENAFARQYEIQVSNDAQHWIPIYKEINGDGGIDEIKVGNQTSRYIRMYGTQRGTPWGYSLWEFGVE
ncbi:MAG: discoidin domain-containing protein [Candidatus Aureabacteria bacterium]|nr:discoidin domain-containing protein [Candidatus Auribacterota bacterium]